MASRSAKAIVTLLAAIAFVVVVFLLVRSRHEPPSPDLPPSSVRHVYMAGGDFTRAELNVPILPVKGHALDQIRIALQSPGDRTADSAAAEWAGLKVLLIFATGRLPVVDDRTQATFTLGGGRSIDVRCRGGTASDIDLAITAAQLRQLSESRSAELSILGSESRLPTGALEAIRQFLESHKPADTGPKPSASTSTSPR